MSLSTRVLSAAAASATLVALSIPVASAHDAVVSSNPADGSTVSEFPDEVTLEFSGLPREGFNTLAISDAESEEIIFTGEPVIEGRVLTLDLPEDVEPGDGDYRIGFQITSSDGHATQGMSTFTVSAESATAAPVSPSAEPAAERDGESAQQEDPGPLTWVVSGLAVLALVAVVVMILRKGRLSRELGTNTDHPENN